MRKNVALIIISLLFSLSFLHPIQAFNQDLGRHLLLGNLILKTGHVPTTNLLSFTQPDYPFLNHHYLAEVIYAGLFTIGGINLLLLLTILLFVLTYVLVAKARKTELLGLLAASILFFGMMIERTDIRPESFSYFFLSIFIFILYRYRQKRNKLIYMLPFIQLAWANIHIYFIMGIAVTGLFLIDSCIAHRKNLFARQNIELLFITISLPLASLLTPHGLSGLLYPFTIFNNYGYSIEENQSAFFFIQRGIQKSSVYYLFATIIIAGIGAFIARKQIRLIDCLLLFVFGLLGLSAVRHIPLFAIVTFPTLLFVFSSFFSQPFYKKPKTVTILTIVGFLCIVGSVFQTLSKEGFGIEDNQRAKSAADFMQREHIEGPLFNNFDIGSYLSYRLYPQTKVFIDGRPEAYPASFFQDTYIPMQQSPETFAKVDAHYKFNAIFFSHTDQTPWAASFISTILQNNDFVPVYLDQEVIILLRNSAKNSNLIKKFGLSKTDTPLVITTTNPTEDDYKRAINFYMTTNQLPGLEKTLTELVHKNPKNCSYLKLLSSVMAQTGNPANVIYQTQIATNCQ